jgi:hypothetical protein
MKMMKKREPGYLCILLLVIISLAMISAVSAFTATLASPADPATVLHSGDAIDIQIAGIAINNQLIYKITSSDLQTSGNSVSLSDVNMPFATKSGFTTTKLTTTGIAPHGTITMGRISGSSVTLTSTTTAPDTEYVVYNGNIPIGRYSISASGTKTGTYIGIDYNVNATISDPGSGSGLLSLTLKNINTGHLTIDVIDGTTGSSVLVGGPKIFTITVPEGPADTGHDAAPGPAAGPPAAAAPPALLAPTGISPTTVTIQHNPEGKVLADYVIETDPAAGFSSAVNIGIGTTVRSSSGQPVAEISVTPLNPTTVSAVAQSGVFTFSGLSVECEPSGAQFSGGSATISFTLTPAQWADAISKVNGNTAAMTIQTYDPATKSWAEITTTVNPVTHTVSAQVTHFSTYALFYKLMTETASVSQPAAAATTASAPVVTPATTMLAPISTTKTPGLPGIVVIGVVGLVGFFIMRKKQ